MEQRIRMILSPSDLERIKFIDATHLTVDVHGFSPKHMKYFLKNIAAIIRGPFEMTVIHGYNHGTALLETIRKEKIFYRTYETCLDEVNKGITYVTFA